MDPTNDRARWHRAARLAREDPIDRLEPATRIEIQDFYILRDGKRRDFVGVERRSPRYWSGPVANFCTTKNTNR